MSAMRAVIRVSLVGIMLGTVVWAAPPEIAHVYPDFGGDHLRADAPQIITGENFAGQGVEVWVWTQRSDDKAIEESGRKLGDEPAKLPEKPPKDARRIEPLDVDKQVITARLGQNIVVWVKNAEGFSAPYLLNVAKPIWMSEEQAEPGAILHVFGFGLRLLHRKSYMALRGAQETLVFPPRQDYGLWESDSHLVQLKLPTDLKPGDYHVYIHNSLGGELGWRKAGRVRVAPKQEKPVRVFDVRAHGGKGDGVANDLAAIKAAMSAAQAAGGGVVFFPPGTYAVDESVRVPSGVTLRGASRENTVIKGFGYDPAQGSRPWYSPDNKPSSVILLGSNTGLESLTVSGCVSKGAGGEALVETVPDEVVVPAGGEVHDVTVEGCQLRGQEVHPTHRTVLYRFGQALVVGQTSRRIRVLNNATEGSIVLRVTTRSEIVNNRIHGGGVAAAAYETIMDRNILTDAPSRILFYPRRHSYVRFNEMHGFSRFSWNNASESYLVHGGSVKTVGSPTGASANTLVDAKQAWKPGHYKDATVVITSGRGFGQYRWVLGNTENTLTLEQPWRVMPDATSEYVVGMFHTDSAFYGNLNEGCGTLHLWLDCIGIVVERHRASLSGGTDVWGRDVTSVNEQGVADKLGYFHPAWYNMFLNNWLDGSFMRMVSGDRADNAYLGPVLFANYAVANTIRQPHMRKHAFVNPYEEQAIAAGGVKVGNQHPWLPTTTRGGTSHSVVVGNFVSYTAAGVVVTERARKTFVLNNDFQEVDKPVLDRGARTVMKGNRQFISDEKGDYHQPLPDAIGERDLGPRTPPKYAPAEAGKRGPLSAAAEKLRPFIASVAYVDADIRSLAKRDECQKRLNELFLLLKKHGAALPRAAFYPEKPATASNSLQVILGKEAERHLQCPSVPDLRELGRLHYVWNETLSGKKLADIKDPAHTWLLMDFVAPHDWMVSQQHCGHGGGVNVLLADGSVRWVSPFKWTDWDKP